MKPETYSLTEQKKIEQCLDEGNFIILNNYENTHIDGGTLNVHLN